MQNLLVFLTILLFNTSKAAAKVVAIIIILDKYRSFDDFYI